MRGPTSSAALPTSPQELLRRIIAGEQQMVAVVDLHAERGVEIGAAAAARMRGRFVDD